MLNGSLYNVSESPSTKPYTCWRIIRSTAIICYAYCRNYVTATNKCTLFKLMFTLHIYITMLRTKQYFNNIIV